MQATTKVETLPVRAPAYVPQVPTAPQVAHNCPRCDHWIEDGILRCPDCDALIYGPYLHALGIAASFAEREGRFWDAREMWKSAQAWLPEDAVQMQQIELHMAILEDQALESEGRSGRWMWLLGPLLSSLLLAGPLKQGLLYTMKWKPVAALLTQLETLWPRYGWAFAIGLVLCVLLHKVGHYVAVRGYGMPANRDALLPVPMSYVRWNHAGLNVSQLSVIALAGPFAGMIAAYGCWALSLWMHKPLFLALAAAGAFLGLVNLVPVLWADGAQAVYALNRTGRLLLLCSCIVFFFTMHQAIFLVIATGMAWRAIAQDPPQETCRSTLGAYFVLLPLLGGILYLIAHSGLV